MCTKRTKPMGHWAEDTEYKAGRPQATCKHAKREYCILYTVYGILKCGQLLPLVEGYMNRHYTDLPRSQTITLTQTKKHGFHTKKYCVEQKKNVDVNPSEKENTCHRTKTNG